MLGDLFGQLVTDLLSFFFRKRFNGMKNIAIVLVFIATVTLIALIPSPVGTRFRAVFAGNDLLFTQKKFTPGTYFNGVQFRLLQWRFTYEILNEQHAWLLGATPVVAVLYSLWFASRRDHRS